MPTRARIAITVIIVLAALGIAIPATLNAYQNATRPPVVITFPPGLTTTSSPISAQFKIPPAVPTAQSAIPDGLIYVHIAGAVHNPNLYKLPNGDRFFDAIHEAGGTLATADIDAINLAEPVHDGEKVYIPTKAEIANSPIGLNIGGNEIGLESSIGRSDASPAPKTSSRTAAHVDKLKAPSDGTIDLNTASADDLQRIPGVGPSMAAKILLFRQTYGRFRTPDDLREIKGVGDKKFAKMEPFVRV